MKKLLNQIIDNYTKIESKDSKYDFNNLLLKNAILTEKLCIRARDMLIEKCENKEAILEYYQQEVDDLGIKIYIENDILKIKMPILLPFKKIKNLRLTKMVDNDSRFETLEQCNAIFNSLQFALIDFIQNNNIDRSKYEYAEYCYTHYYNCDFPKYHIPDNDNYELKQITDLVAAYISPSDDSFDKVVFKYQTDYADKKYTLLEIIPRR